MKGREAGAPWTGRQPVAGLTLKDRHSLTLHLDWSIHLPSLSLGCGGKPEAGETPHMHREKTQTPHRKAGAEKNPFSYLLLAAASPIQAHMGAEVSTSIHWYSQIQMS